MTFSDYLIDITLISLVLIQIRARRLTVKALVLPLGLVAYVAYEYLRGVPTAHNDLFLIVGAAVVGATLGGLAGRFTAVTKAADGSVWAKAGLAAAALWILGTGGRLAFQLYASHGGGPEIAHFERDARHHERLGLDSDADPDGAERGHHPHCGARLAVLPPARGLAVRRHPFGDGSLSRRTRLLGPRPDKDPRPQRRAVHDGLR